MEIRRKVTAKGLWRSLYPVLVYMLVQVAVSILYVMAVMAFSVLDGESPVEAAASIMDRYMDSTITVVLLAAAVSIPLFAWLYSCDRKKKLMAGFQEDWFPLTEWILLWSVIGTAALALFCNGLINILPLALWSDSYEEISEALYSGNIWIQIAAVAFFGPAVEELVMRGLMYQRFRAMMRPAAAVFWSALVFGVFHGNLIQGIYVFLMGLFLAWMMERTQRLFVPMLGHMSANLFVVILEERELLELFYGSVTSFLGTMAISGIVFLWSFMKLRER